MRDFTRQIKLVGIAIRTLRMEREMTLEDVSDLSGVSVKNIEQIEQGIRDPALSEVVSLAAALECSPVMLTECIDDVMHKSPPMSQLAVGANRSTN